MDNLIKSLPSILKASGSSPEVLEAACAAAWKHAVGEALNAHAVPTALNGSTLVVAVADNEWKSQLERMRAQFLFRLNSVLGQPVVKSIDLRVDSNAIAERRNAPTRVTQRPGYSVPAELLSASAAISDPDLRRAFLGAATSCVKRTESPKQ
jgi:predicted nucleic acid-binding Zn ribbon protein